MGKSITVEMARLDTAAGTLESLSFEYQGIARQLMQEASTMGTAWQGEDNLAFVAQISGFTDELDRMAQKLASASETLSVQSANYKTRQDAISASVKSLAN